MDRELFCIKMLEKFPIAILLYRELLGIIIEKRFPNEKEKIK